MSDGPSVERVGDSWRVNLPDGEFWLGDEDTAVLQGVADLAYRRVSAYRAVIAHKRSTAHDTPASDDLALASAALAEQREQLTQRIAEAFDLSRDQLAERPGEVLATERAHQLLVSGIIEHAHQLSEAMTSPLITAGPPELRVGDAVTIRDLDGTEQRFTVERRAGGTIMLYRNA